MDDYLFSDDDMLLEQSEEPADLAAIPASMICHDEDDSDSDFMLMDMEAEAVDLISGKVSDLEGEDVPPSDNSRDVNMPDTRLQVSEERRVCSFFVPISYIHSVHLV